MKPPVHGRHKAAKPAAAPPMAAPGRAGGMISAKGPVLGAAIKGMGHTKPATTSVATDRGVFKIK